VVTSAALAAAGPPASAAPAAYHSCGTLHAGGKTWQYGGAGISCAAAKALLQKLAAMPVPPRTRPYYPGTYLVGGHCLGGVVKGRTGIQCIGDNGNQALSAATT
jgi:hypothetical protein